ncbi:DUF4386 domain-containing protein [Adhaeribacter aquaticus]|uniref:DUF4386 domain-containing protein n=1 Tax=Adhaeribacter aquaticus TaxID=299567 RepID=UPI00041D9DE9|nr:DUF4386 domain-containing protein [Adhaeribacter aquaticus]
MKKNRSTAIAAGVFFIIAAVAAIVSLILYNPILHDADYILNGAENSTQIKWGAFFEIITAFAVIGTAVTLFPVLKKYNESMAVATVTFRLLEATIIIIGIMSLLTILTLQQHPGEISANSAAYLVNAKLLVALHDWTFLFGPNIVLGPSTFITGYLLYRSGLVPDFISVLGMVAGPLVSASGVMVMFGMYPQVSVLGALTCLPVFLYEMSLAVWLLAKGFKQEEKINEPKVDLQFYANALGLKRPHL